MAIEGYGRLCGGTFFVLLTSAMKAPVESTRMQRGGNEGVYQKELLYDLFMIALNDKNSLPKKKNFKDDFKGFKTCTVGKSKRLHMVNNEAGKLMKQRMEKEYTTCREEMFKIIDKYLDGRKYDVLARAIVEVIIHNDSSYIPDEQKFYILNDGKAIKKSELETLHKIDLATFLLGIWMYVLLEIEDNTIGRETYEEWCPQIGIDNSERMYTKDYGEVSRLQLIVESVKNSENLSSSFPESTDDSIEEAVETEVLDENCFRQDGNSSPKGVNAFYINSGNGIQLIDNHGVINFSFNKKES